MDAFHIAAIGWPEPHERWIIGLCGVLFCGMASILFRITRKEWQYLSMAAAACALLAVGIIGFDLAASWKVEDKEQKDNQEQHIVDGVLRIPNIFQSRAEVFEGIMPGDLAKIRVAGGWLGHEDGSLTWQWDGEAMEFTGKYGTLSSEGDNRWVFKPHTIEIPQDE